MFRHNDDVYANDVRRDFPVKVKMNFDLASKLVNIYQALLHCESTEVDFIIKELEGLVSNYSRVDKIVYRIQVPLDPSSLLPFWMLLALIPPKKKLSIGEIVVYAGDNNKHSGFEVPKTYYSFSKFGINRKGCLVIERLVVLCLWSQITDGMRVTTSRLKEDLLQYNIHCITCKVIVVVPENFCSVSEYGHLFRRLKMDPSDQITFAENKGWHGLSTNESGLENYPNISSWVEKLVEIPHFEEQTSVHTSLELIIDLNKRLMACIFNGNAAGILIAVLGEVETVEIETDHRYTGAHTIFYKTMYNDDTVINGATAKTINSLREKWDGGSEWNEKYQNLIVVIPYGGKYREDDMIAIHEATDEGIIIVCTAGPPGGEVAYPAALGNVISVGTIPDGPKGREIDISAHSHEYQYLSVPSNYPATFIVAGWVAHLLSRMNALINSTSLNPPLQHIAQAIRNVEGHFHTCVIRELIVSEGNGSHDPQFGYGNEGTILKLLRMSDEELLQKLADILLKRNMSKRNDQEHIQNYQSIKEN